MALIAQLILLVLCALMFVVNRRYKFAILILSTICFSFIVLTFIPFGGARYVLSECFILSEIPFIVTHLRNLRKSIIWKVLVVALIAIIIQMATSPHYNSDVQNMIRMLIMDFIAKYLVLAYAFICIAVDKDLRPALKVSFYGLLVLTIFGVLNYISGSAIFINEIGSRMETNDITELLGDKFTYSDRFRVQAMFMNPFDYGYICIVLAIFHGWGYVKGHLSKFCFYTSMVCCIFGIVTCGCRTVIICALLAYVVYLLLGENLKKRSQYFLSICIIGLISYSTIPYVKDRVDLTLSVFETESDYGGSSVDMRTLQYATVLKYIDGYELFGRGKDFFQIDLGFSEGRAGLVDIDLHGLEGVIMVKLLEGGVVGVILYLVIFITLLFYIWKYRRVDRQLFALSFALCVAYFSFANMTGELLSVFPTLLVLGGFLSILYNKEKKLNSEYNMGIVMGK